LYDPTNTSPTYAGDLVYRAHRIPDLYPHPAVPVANLTVLLQNGQPLLQFSADPVRTYLVQSSDDLVNWNDIGDALPDDPNGDFSYQDTEPDGTTAVFYRVITQ
jgi:hypothetical protein